VTLKLKCKFPAFTGREAAKTAPIRQTANERFLFLVYNCTSNWRFNMSDPATYNDVENIVDHAIGDISSDLSGVSDLKYTVNQIATDVEHIRNEMARLTSLIESMNKQSSASNNAFRM
jgi:hypothetical protein